MYDNTQLEWCNQYIKVLRGIELQKYNEISAKVFEFMDVYTKLSPQEIANNQAAANKRSSKGDQTRKDLLHIMGDERDILFGIWANVTSKNQYGHDIVFRNHIAQLPQKQASG